MEHDTPHCDDDDVITPVDDESPLLSIGDHFSYDIATEESNEGGQENCEGVVHASTRKRRRTYRVLARPADYPKRPPTAYALYVSEKRKEMIHVKSRKRPWQIIREIAELWRSESSEVRRHYEERSCVLQQKYKDEKLKWEEDHPEGVDRILSKKGRKGKGPPVVAVEAGRPKRPPSAYVLFSNEHRHDVADKNPNASSKDVCAILAGMWSKTSPMERQAYQEAAQRKSAEYRQQLREFNARRGHSFMKKAIKQHESLRVQLQAPSDEEEEVVSEDETSAETTQGDGTNGYHVFVQEPMRDVPGRSPHSNLVDVHSMVEHRWTSLPDVGRQRYVNSDRHRLPSVGELDESIDQNVFLHDRGDNAGVRLSIDYRFARDGDHSCPAHMRECDTSNLMTPFLKNSGTGPHFGYVVGQTEGGSNVDMPWAENIGYQ